MSDHRCGLSVVMPVKDDAARALRAIAGLRSEMADAEVVVVDNDPGAPSPVLERAADRYVLAGGSVGAARLAGLRAASGSAILFLDADQQVISGRLKPALDLLLTTDAVVLAERSANHGLCAGVLDAERAVTERAGFGIPRLFRRCVFDGLIEGGNGLSTMAFGEDSYLAAGAESVRLAPDPVLLHDDPRSVGTLLCKYVAYGRRASAQANGCGLRRKRHPTGTAVASVGAHIPLLAPVAALKLAKALAYSYGRMSEQGARWLSP